ncbi:hypothetical protein GCM10025771_27060 [Niveibacterium umoris]|uniref:CheY-like chemotaxis protein n=1 Tax=Niveibacterium umoris TaxID=1193620 RepID=A0A840BKF5_9RHOO|nr:response regulator [Niveibacterium umoris]MBB4012102.1 CheY-like chemotaxis protein [Niveibacterium umoris]
MQKALIIDDSEPNRRLPALILGQLGWATAEAENGYSALEAVQRERFDCILLDILLPDLQGDEVCRRLRDHPLNGSTWIVAYTAESPEQFAEVTARCRFDALLTKPITRKSLINALPPQAEPHK